MVGSIERGDAEEAHELLVPVERLEVHEHGAAGVGDVGDVQPAVVPPVRFQVSHVSVLPKIASPRSAASRTPSTFSRIHCTLPAEKYVAGGSPAFCRMTSPLPSRSRAEAMRSVRVSCQTMAL
jgi:hypothetical protein